MFSNTVYAFRVENRAVSQNNDTAKKKKIEHITTRNSRRTTQFSAVTTQKPEGVAGLPRGAFHFQEVKRVSGGESLSAHAYFSRDSVRAHQDLITFDANGVA